MDMRPLRPEEVSALRAMVEEQVDLHLQSSNPEHAYFPGGIYTVEWTLGSLAAEHLERVRWLLDEIDFKVGEVTARTVPSELPGVVNEFHTLYARRDAVFLPDCLWGEALLIEGLACGWGVHVERFGLIRDLRRGRQSPYGPMGGDIA